MVVSPEFLDDPRMATKIMNYLEPNQISMDL